MSAHTPGPWFAVQPDHANGWWIVSTDRRGEDSVDQSRDGGFSEANAHLIAAAPCLLEALEAAVEWMETLRASGDAGLWNWTEGDQYSKARAAIAKAKGETP